MKKWSLLTIIGIVLASCIEDNADPYFLLQRPLQPPTNANLRSIQAFDDSTVWATGNRGTILKSLDAGENWKMLTVPGHESSDFRDIHLFGKNKAVVMSIGSPAKIFRTDDGGKSWSLNYLNEDPEIFLDGLAFFDDKIGIAFGDAIDNYIPIIRTTNGGNSWNMLPKKNLPVALSKEAGFAASGTSIRIMDDTTVIIGLGYPRGRVLRSTDQGLTWKFSLSQLGNKRTYSWCIFPSI